MKKSKLLVTSSNFHSVPDRSIENWFIQMQIFLVDFIFMVSAKNMQKIQWILSKFMPCLGIPLILIILCIISLSSYQSYTSEPSVYSCYNLIALTMNKKFPQIYQFRHFLIRFTLITRNVWLYWCTQYNPTQKRKLN